MKKLTGVIWLAFLGLRAMSALTRDSICDYFENSGRVNLYHVEKTNLKIS